MSKRMSWDIDGTIDLQVWSCYDHIDRNKIFLNPNVNPDIVKYIITGRPEITRKRTLELLKRVGITPKIMCMNVTGNMHPMYLYSMKANYLRILSSSIYVDDDPRFKTFMPKFWDGIVIDTTELGRYV